MSYDRQYSPPRNAGGGWDAGADPYGREKDPYERQPPSPAHSSSRRGVGGDEWYQGGAYDDPYSMPRRDRSPDDRRKRRRSPSPITRAVDTYIPSYQRDRSPPPYRDSRRSSDYYAGGPYGGGFGGTDRYDSRSAYGTRDSYDAYGASASSYDRRPPANLPSRRSNLRPPQDLPYLASFAYYRDWARDEDHRLYEDKEKLGEAYKKYKSSFLYKHQKAFFDEIKEAPWCKEKYGVGPEEVEERKKQRERGRVGKMDEFLAALEGGELEGLSFDHRVTTSSSPPKKEAKLEPTEDGKPTDASGAVKAEEQDAGDSKPVVKEEETRMEEDAESKEQVKAEADAIAGGESHREEGNDAIKQEGEGNGSPMKTEEEKEAADQFEDTSKKGDEDSILVPPAPTTLFIKSLSPEISRADLTAHCKQVEGFDYIALGEPNPSKKFHRIGWVVFKPDADMEAAVEKLCESKINNFTLHMHLADKPGYQRLRVAPTAMSSIERVRLSLEQVKTLISNLEKEAADDRGSKAIEAKIAAFASKLEADQQAESSAEDHDEYIASQERSEKVDRQSLDWYLQYLRAVFHTCFYCVSTSDFAEELTRKCVKHVRRYIPPEATNVHVGKTRKDNEANWMERFDEKIPLIINRDGVEPLDYGGESYQDELAKTCKPHIIVEDEGKFRCKTCKKLFKAAPFVEKHILNKHPELVGDRLEQLKYYNNFVLDPNHPMPAPLVDVPSHANNQNFGAGGAYYATANGMASTFGAFNQMFNPTFNQNYGGMMGFGYNSMFQPMASGGFNGFNGGAGMYGAGTGGGAMPMSAGARALNDRIGARPDDYGMRGGGKRQRRESGPPPPPPKGAKMDPRAGRLHAYTDLDGPPAGGGGEDMMLDY